MCGIAGYCGPSDRFGEENLQSMLRAIEHRGPDDSGMFNAKASQAGNRSVWLGSRRLAIQDLSPAGHQPMTDHATGTTIAFNGEIYNFLDLRTELERAGNTFQSRCDTEVALRAWCTEGLPAVARWRGMFGVAFWDAPKQELWLIRDHWGIKPLYYWQNGSALVFCSEVRGILASGLVPRRLSPRGVRDYLSFGAVQDPVTIVEGVYALLPGQALRLAKGQVQLYDCPTAPIEPGFGEENVDAVLREIVRQQLISDVPTVVFLSGGIDSSIISLLARQEAGPRLSTLSLVFDEDRYSEGEYAKRVAAHIGTTHHEARLTAGDATTQAVEAIELMDQPSADGINTYVVCQAARRLGFKVALSGLGGDEFFGGYPTFRRTAQLRSLAGLLRKVPSLAGAASRALAPLMPTLSSPARKLVQYLRYGDPAEHPYFLQRKLFHRKEIEAVYANSGPDPADTAADTQLQRLTKEAEGLDPLNQISFLEARVYMGNMLLRDSDQMSMANSLELRVPFVDQRLAANLLSVPGHRKGFGQKSKMWLYQKYASRLPEEVFSRRKMGFTLPFDPWLRGALRKQIEETLRANPCNLWNPQAAARIWRQFASRRLDWSRLWALYVLSKWVAKHIEDHTQPIAIQRRLDQTPSPFPQGGRVALVTESIEGGRA